MKEAYSLIILKSVLTCVCFSSKFLTVYMYTHMNTDANALLGFY